MIVIALPALIGLMLALIVAGRKQRQLRHQQALTRQIMTNKLRVLDRTELELHLAYQRIDELETRCSRQHQQILDLLKKKQKSTFPLYEFYLVHKGDEAHLVPYHKN